MNWLAHIFVSENDIDYQLGNLLSDHLKGKLWEGSSEKYAQGVTMHKNIDLYTDTHECVLTSKSRLGDSGYLRGVVIDIVYDHLLLKHWQLYSTQSLDDFIDEFNQNAWRAIKTYPEKARAFVSKLILSNCLTSYASMEGIKIAFERVDRRLSARLAAKDNTSGYFALVNQRLPDIEQDFLLYFPDLLRFFSSKTPRSSLGKWIKESA